MASDRASKGPAGRSGGVVSGFLVGSAMAALLLGLGVPSFLAAVIATPGVDAITQIRFGQSPPRDRFEDAADALASAGQFWSDGSLETDRGYLLLQRAMDLAPGEAREQAYRGSIEATRAGLATAPVQPSAWARLAFLELRQGNHAAALSALRMSLITGPVTPELMASRLEIGLGLSSLFDKEMIGLMKRQIRVIWVLDPDYVNSLSTNTQAADLVRAALAELDEKDLREFIRQNHR